MSKSLLDKLGFKSGIATKLVNVPDDLGASFAAAQESTARNPVWVLGFAKDSAGIRALAKEAVPHYIRGGHLWLCYPKKSGPIKTDITRDIGWEPVLKLNLLPVMQISIDDTWSTLRFRYRDEIKTLTRKSDMGG
jgi:hypothetical protein